MLSKLYKLHINVIFFIPNIQHERLKFFCIPHDKTTIITHNVGTPSLCHWTPLHLIIHSVPHLLLKKYFKMLLHLDSADGTWRSHRRHYAAAACTNLCMIARPEADRSLPGCQAHSTEIMILLLRRLIFLINNSFITIMQVFSITS